MCLEKNAAWILVFAALTGLLLSLGAHLSTYFGINPQKEVPELYLLHFGSILLWIPAVIVSVRMTKGHPRNEFWERTIGTLPRWIRAGVYAMGWYAMINFILFVLQNEGVAGVIDGKQVLHNHGHIIRQVTAKEFDQCKILDERGFSGHWIFFYGAAAAMLYAWILVQREKPPGRAVSKASS